MTYRTLCVLVAALAVGGCDQAQAPSAAPAVTESADEFVARVNNGLAELNDVGGAAAWVQANFITVDTAKLNAKFREDYAKFLSESIDDSKRVDLANADATSARSINLLKLYTSEPAPNDAAMRRELAEITTSMEGQYGAGKYCPGDGECLTLGDLSNIIAESRDSDALLDAWVGWRTVSPAYKADYQRFVEITNAGAAELGFDNLGTMWQSGYDMPPAEFDAEAKRLWGQVEPLYEELHCYVRRKLGEEYGEETVPQDGTIPAHLLGNMWAQQWGEIYDLVEPYPGVPGPDVSKALVDQEWDAEKMTRTAEDFFVSLGLPELPDTFYERSLLTKPADRDVVCHASAWDLGAGSDPRIKMCIEPTAEMLSTIYHELGHIYYFIAYKDQPALFRTGAHDGFHEGIGDTIVLSLTPDFLATLGLVGEVGTGQEALINTQMRMALDKVAFLPFGKLIDEWRWRVFSGEIGPDEYNAGWWQLREQYQGVSAPVARSEADFDPGAKYHVPANTPYTRYFLAHILQFQFQQALCDAAGFEGPLHECSIYGSEAAGEKLEAMLAAGASEPWQETLYKITGTREMDASAIQAYFEPLNTWLKDQNQGQSCGW